MRSPAYREKVMVAPDESTRKLSSIQYANVQESDKLMAQQLENIGEALLVLLGHEKQ